MALFGGNKNKNTAGKKGNGGESENGDSPSIAPEDAKLEFSEKDIKKARKWFEQARKLNEDRNFDYAIECYLEGLKIWPEAVEEGHQHLRVAAYARWEKGGKKPSTIEAMKHPMSGRNAVQAMINAEWLWARDPNSVSYMEGMLKNAAKAKCEEALLFIAPIYFEAIITEKKLNKNRFTLLKKTYEKMSDRCENRKDFQQSLVFLQGANTVLEALHNISGPSQDYTQELADLSTKITIIKGRYDSAGTFRESVTDQEGQKDIHDRERMVLEESRLDELISEAKQEWKDNPGVSAKLMQLVDLLCRDETPEREEEAIDLLDREYEDSSAYNYKMRADDLRLKQHRREVRLAKESGHKDSYQEAQLEQLKFELKIYRERIKHYPTDNKIKFDYGWALMRARKYDDAIPVLQEARNDPKNRYHCMSRIGRCFYEKGYHSQAIAQYNQAIQEYDLVGDDLSKELHYWLGRSSEACDQWEDAQRAYGQIIQWDYNYRDVRKRLDAVETRKSNK